MIEGQGAKLKKKKKSDLIEALRLPSGLIPLRKGCGVLGPRPVVRLRRLDRRLVGARACRVIAPHVELVPFDRCLLLLAVTLWRHYANSSLFQVWQLHPRIRVVPARSKAPAASAGRPGDSVLVALHPADVVGLRRRWHRGRPLRVISNGCHEERRVVLDLPVVP